MVGGGKLTLRCGACKWEGGGGGAVGWRSGASKAALIRNGTKGGARVRGCVDVEVQ